MTLKSGYRLSEITNRCSIFLEEMSLRRKPYILFALATFLTGCATTDINPHGDPGLTAENRAVRFLAREVPAWHRDNGCFSCHNNGDAARALYGALKLGHRIPTASLRETARWVANPGMWDHNKGNPALNDPRLADLQFASTLAAAIDAGRIPDRAPLIEAARRLVARQDANGSWPVEPGNSLGTPATYGPALATCMAIRTLRTLRTLRSADAPGTEEAIEKAEDWLRGIRPNNVPAAAAVLLALNSPSDQKQRSNCLDLIRRAQTPSGGWGPYADAPAEPFDTAIALLALSETNLESEWATTIERGRAFLISEQNGDGGWAPTTRPPGGDSYAQRISTCGWATQALMATRSGY